MLLFEQMGRITFISSQITFLSYTLTVQVSNHCGQCSTNYQQFFKSISPTINSKSIKRIFLSMTAFKLPTPQNLKNRRRFFTLESVENALVGVEILQYHRRPKFRENQFKKDANKKFYNHPSKVPTKSLLFLFKFVTVGMSIV